MCSTAGDPWAAPGAGFLLLPQVLKHKVLSLSDTILIFFFFLLSLIMNDLSLEINLGLCTAVQ